MKKLLILCALLAFPLALFAAPEIGKIAPAFSLKDPSGKLISLSQFKGKTVVLEWTNFGCPFVKKHYGTGNMQKLQKEATAQGVIWLSICSSAPNKQGYYSPADAKKAVLDEGSKATDYLLDSTGEVGKLYGAKCTPELFIINKEGILVYQGAIDDVKSVKPEDVATAHNYVSAALKEILAGKPVTTPSTSAYGCSVKYEN